MTTTLLVLDDSYLTKIADEPCGTRCRVRVLLLARINVECVVESECFPRSILERDHEEPFQISLASGPTFPVRLGNYNLNPIGRDHFAGKLIPVRSPFLVTDKSLELDLVSFDILNFTSIFEWSNLSADDKSTPGRTWEVNISDTRTMEERRQFKEMGGYVITHKGNIQCSDKSLFTVGDVWPVLEALSRYLSFSQGARCAVIHVRGTRACSKEIPIVWGSTHVHNSGERRGVLYSVNVGIDPLASGWSGFLSIVANRNDEEAICRAIDWYLWANNSDFGSGLVLGQAALELLASNNKRGNIAEKIEKAINSVKVNSSIPPQCKELVKVAKRYGWESGPTAITQIRNDLVHAKRKFPHVRPEAQLEARELALWYIELLLLSRFQYRGCYKVRSSIAIDAADAVVPWMKDHDTSSDVSARSEC